jgi:hypothetical protein
MQTRFYDVHFVYTCIIRLYCVYLFLTSLEYVYLRQQFSSGGIYSWKIMKFSKHPLIGQARLSIVFDQPGVLIIILIRLLLSIYLFVTPLPALAAYPIAAVVITSLLLALRNSIGNDGTDQMSNILGITILISFLTRDAKVASIGLCFIAVQSILAYDISGLAKLLSPKWRSGVAVFQVMNTETFGYKQIATWLHRSPTLSFLLSWNIMLFEIFFFLTAFLNYPYFFIVMVWGLLFHLFNAVVMGLNHFFWIFLATYPAIVYLNLILHH